MENQPYIYHLVSPNYWEKFVDKEAYVTKNLADIGFIHCCFEDQIEFVLKVHCADLSKILILKLDIKVLKAKLKIESADGQKFPHIYGPINKSAIVEMIEIKGLK